MHVEVPLVEVPFFEQVELRNFVKQEERLQGHADDLVCVEFQVFDSFAVLGCVKNSFHIELEENNVSAEEA